MPRPLGSDRLSTDESQRLVLRSLRPKGWTGRTASGPTTPAASGTAVRWDDEVYEVVTAEEPAGRPARYVLEPWDERWILRAVVDYAAPPPAGGSPGTPAGSAWTPATRETLRALAFGLLPVLFLRETLPLRLLGGGPMTFVHELGHTLVSWAFGCPAVPIVVVTYTVDQIKVFALAIWAGLILLSWRHRETLGRRRLIALGLVAAVYPVLAITQAYETLIVAGGHGAEIAIAGYLFFQAMRPRDPLEAWARPVIAFYAWYVTVSEVVFLRGLATSRNARLDYQEVSYTGGDNDLVKVARTLDVPLETVAGAALAVTVVVAVAGLLLGLRASAKDLAGSSHGA